MFLFTLHYVRVQNYKQLKHILTEVLGFLLHPLNPGCWRVNALITRQVYNLFQEPVEQLPLGLSIAEEKIRQF